eukprot:5296117-Alexandrium_andersonii.AAC.1
MRRSAAYWSSNGAPNSARATTSSMLLALRPARITLSIISQALRQTIAWAILLRCRFARRPTR